MFRNLRKTVLCDIDGTLIQHKDSLAEMVKGEMDVLPGVYFKLQEWREKDYYIVLTTARPEGSRGVTERQLAKVGIYYDQLVMGLPIGPRVVINDRKPDGTDTAQGVCVERNKGLSHVQI